MKLERRLTAIVHWGWLRLRHRFGHRLSLVVVVLAVVTIAGGGGRRGRRVRSGGRGGRVAAVVTVIPVIAIVYLLSELLFRVRLEGLTAIILGLWLWNWFRLGLALVGSVGPVRTIIAISSGGSSWRRARR